MNHVTGLIAGFHLVRLVRHFDRVRVGFKGAGWQAEVRFAVRFIVGISCRFSRHGAVMTRSPVFVE